MQSKTYSPEIKLSVEDFVSLKDNMDVQLKEKEKEGEKEPFPSTAEALLVEGCAPTTTPLWASRCEVASGELWPNGIPVPFLTTVRLAFTKLDSGRGLLA